MVKHQLDHDTAVATERRSEPRIKTNHTVLFRTPDTLPVEACLLDISTKGARLRASEPVPVGIMIRVDSQEMLLFGTVTRCTPNRGAYDVGIALSRPLELLGELRRLNASLLAEPDPF